MNDLTFAKELLLAQLKKNRAEHEKEYKEAVTNYRAKLVEILTTKLQDATDGKKVDHYIPLTVPTEYLNEYDRAIKMLELCQNDNMVLTPQQFSQYWLDEWNWKSSYFTTNMAYSDSVAGKANPANF